jgi:hypothetical protein
MLNNIAVPLLIVVSGFICLEFFIPIAIGELSGDDLLGEKIKPIEK